MGWGRIDRPVINIDWDDARAYANWLGAITGSNCGLPSEAQWEYAARAGTTTEYALPAPGGSDDIEGKGLANCGRCGGGWGDDDPPTAPVRSFDANGWGLYDMHGNVSGWVGDCWHFSYEDAPEDGSPWLKEGGGDCNLRVQRGGAWLNPANDARSASRLPTDRLFLHQSIGFRVMCSSPIDEH